jgi:hypothetical protein
MTNATTELAPDHTTTVDAYFDLLNETDPDVRARLVADVWTEDGAFFDPLHEATGHEALVELIAGLQAQFPGQRFARTSGIDSHHGVVRFGWELRAGDGTTTVAGLDVGIVAPDGRLTRLAGFFGPLPELENR